MLFAAIDIGSNAGRLLFAQVYEENNNILVEKEALIRVPLRLGSETFVKGEIGQNKILDLINTFKAYKNLIEVYKPITFKACATSALREASNYAEIINMIFLETGIHIELIDGMTEASYVVANHSATLDESKLYFYIDVGGGSTEITVVYKNNPIASDSFKVGTVRFVNNLAIDTEYDRMKKFVKKFESYSVTKECVGSGGNINKLSKLFSAKDTNIISYNRLKEGSKFLKSLGLNERIIRLRLRPDRADVIIPAADIFLKIMKWSKSDIVHVPRIGLADGMIHEMYKEYRSKK